MFWFWILKMKKDYSNLIRAYARFYKFYCFYKSYLIHLFFIMNRIVYYNDYIIFIIDNFVYKPIYNKK